MTSKELTYYPYEALLKDVVKLAIAYDFDRDRADRVKTGFMIGYRNMILKIKACEDKSALHSILPICTKLHEIEKMLKNVEPYKDTEQRLRAFFQFLHINIIGYEQLREMGELFTDLSETESFKALCEAELFQPSNQS